MRRRVLPRRRESGGRESVDGARLCSVVSCRVVSCRIVNKTVRQASRQAGRQTEKASKENTTAEISGMRGGSSPVTQESSIGGACVVEKQRKLNFSKWEYERVRP